MVFSIFTQLLPHKPQKGRPLQKGHVNFWFFSVDDASPGNRDPPRASAALVPTEISGNQCPVSRLVLLQPSDCLCLDRNLRKTVSERPCVSCSMLRALHHDQGNRTPSTSSMGALGALDALAGDGNIQHGHHQRPRSSGAWEHLLPRCAFSAVLFFALR